MTAVKIYGDNEAAFSGLKLEGIAKGARVYWDVVRTLDRGFRIYSDPEKTQLIARGDAEAFWQERPFGPGADKIEPHVDLIDPSARFPIVRAIDDTEVEPGLNWNDDYVDQIKIRPGDIEPFQKVLSAEVENEITGQAAPYVSEVQVLGPIPYPKLTGLPGILRYDAITGPSTRWNCIVPRGQNGAPLYVRVGAGGAIETSADGESWTSRTSGTANMLNFVIYDSFTAAYWAVGAAGTMVKSTDADTWSTVSLPVDVASDTLTGIASNGAGRFVVSNSSSGARGLVSVDSGGTWQVIDLNSGPGSFVVYFDGANFIAGRNPLSGNRFMSYIGASNPTGSWARIEIPTGTETILSITDDGVNRIAVGAGGFIATSPLSGSPATANWTVRTSGTTESLRAFVANGRVNFVGQNGISLQSSDSGATIIAGPPVGVTSFLRYGAHDPYNPTRALVVGDGGVMLAGQYGFRVTNYPSESDRASGTNETDHKDVAYADQQSEGASSPLTVTLDTV